MKIPVRVSDVVRGLAASGVMAAVAAFCNRAGCPIDGGRRLSAARRFSQHFGLNCMDLGAADLEERTADGFSRVGVRESDHRLERRLNRYPTLTRVGNKVAVT